MKLIDMLLRLYPEEFRARYGRDMRVFHRERVLEGRTPWLQIVWDHLTSALVEHMNSLVPDIRYALRGFARRPVFAIVVLATIALGVGANAAIFSVVNAILLRPLPYPQPDQVVSFGHKAPTWLASAPEFVDYQRGLHTFQSLAAFIQREMNLASDAEPERIGMAGVTPGFFGVLGVNPVRGRIFAPDEHVNAQGSVVIMSWALWQRRFAGDDKIVGKTIQLNGRPCTVVGVMPRYFDFPNARTDVWLPLPGFNPDNPGDRTNHYLFMVGRLREGVSVEVATIDASALARRMMADNVGRYDPNQPLQPVIGRVSDNLVGPARPFLLALFGAVGFVLLIVCVNVANLLLARGESRRKEMALRTALGATRRRLVMQLLTECAVLALGGGLLGLAVAWGGVRLLVAAAPGTIPRLDQVGLDWIVISYTFALAVLAGLMFGVVPAFRGSRNAPAEALKEGGKAVQTAGSRAVRRALVIAEVALCVVTLCGASMLLRSLIHLQSNDMGFEYASALTAKLSPLGYSEGRAVTFYSQVLARARALPGVVAAGAVGSLPVVDATGLWGLAAEGQSYDNVPEAPTAAPLQVTPGYFSAMGMPIVQGRDFTDDDRESGPFVAIVSRAMAAQVWPGADPIGKRFRLGGGNTFMTVVGVVNDIRARSFNDEHEPTMYFPYAQTHKSAYFMPRTMSLVVRTEGGPLRFARQIRAIIREFDATVPITNVRTLEAVVETSVAARRFASYLIAAFAVLSLALAGIGIFGVVSYGVSERTFEIGVRLALGADRGRILALVVGDGLAMTSAGLTVGLIGAALVARAIRSMLIGVNVIDVPTLLGVSLILAIVALAAAAIPARRGMSVQPTDALRVG